MNVNLDKSKRLEIYLGGLASRNVFYDRFDRSERLILCKATDTFEDICQINSKTYSMEEIRQRYAAYITQAQSIVSHFKGNSYFGLCSEDNRRTFNSPSFVKSRLISARATPFPILPLNVDRHWGGVFEVNQVDVPFREKDDKLVWRGLTTGNFKKIADSDIYSSRFYVALVNVRHESIDIGYNAIVQISDATSDIDLKIISSKTKGAMSVEAQLRSKFILSLEGNDVATGLKWILNSNSTLIMPPPTCETWACEGELMPFVHYVPVKSDLSDINEVYEWCMRNLAECERIALNGKEFIESFSCREVEEELKMEVVATYFDRIDYSADGSTVEAEILHRKLKQKLGHGPSDELEMELIELSDRYSAYYDMYGDPVFQKELLRYLLQQKRLDDAVRSSAGFNFSRDANWHHILFARLFEECADYSRAAFHWELFLRTHSDHAEGLAGLQRCEKLRSGL